MRRLPLRLELVALALLGLGCAREALPSRPSDSKSDAPARLSQAQRPPFITPSRIVPDALPPSHLLNELPDGTRHYLVSGIRILERPDGSRLYAETRLPTGLYRRMDLPSRFGGGQLLIASAGGSTFLYRAESWLGELVPLTRLPEASREIVAGFDRFYVRLARDNDWIALDPETFERVPLGPLPQGIRIGPMAFADAWRGAVVADLLGPMASFDAGASWRRVELPEGPAVAVVTDGEDLVFATRSARYRLGPGGEVVRDEKQDSKPRHAQKRPSHKERTSLLRAAVESGWPESNETALVAREGALHRVRLGDGAVIASNPQAYAPSLGACHPIALGETAGFVCGAPNGPTSIQAFTPPLSLREVARFAEPRLVLASGTGGLAIQGGCKAQAHESETTERWCVRTREGAMREIDLAGEAGDERIVVLADGRVAIVVPPKPGNVGRLRLVEGEATRSVPLDLGGEATTLAQAVWLRGFEEREPGVLGGFIDQGGEVRGVRIEFDGKVSLAHEGVDPQTTILGGRFALALGSGSHRIRESHDGGFTWSDVDLPANLPRAPVEARACGPVGCVAGGWLRIGWGASEEKTLTAPQLASFSMPRARGLSLLCEPRGETVPAYRAAPATPKPGTTRLRLGRLHVLGGPPTTGPTAARSSWAPFFGLPPPKLEAGQVGFDGGTDPANLRVLAPFRLYAWGPSGASWSRSGKLLARFQDRFATAGPHSTAITQAPFADDEEAARLFDPSGGPPVAWTALPDPSGNAAILFGCRSGRCTGFGATASGKLVRFSGLEPSSAAHASAVRVGTSFFVLVPPPGKRSDDEMVLFRIEGAHAREVSRLPRAWASRQAVPRLVRRVFSQEIGVLVLAPLEVERGTRDWFVLPLDAETGALGEPVRLYGSHLDGNAPPPRCEPSTDGWLVDVHPSPSPLLRVSGLPAASPISLNSAGVRLRLDPGRACIEAVAARADGLSALPARPAERHAGSQEGLPVVAADSVTGRRYEFSCLPQ